MGGTVEDEKFKGALPDGKLGCGGVGTGESTVSWDTLGSTFHAVGLTGGAGGAPNEIGAFFGLAAFPPLPPPEASAGGSVGVEVRFWESSVT